MLEGRNPNFDAVVNFWSTTTMLSTILFILQYFYKAHLATANFFISQMNVTKIWKQESMEEL